ncbi:MAG: hypothetical protein IKU65_06660 [Oscillospiraceae bacterium]|nr:hypothetical protein [Oscillospiraceae bacterium]
MKKQPHLLGRPKRPCRTLLTIQLYTGERGCQGDGAPAKPGFTPTEYSKKIGNKTICALDSIEKKIGVHISIGAPTGNAPGAHNGYYENGNIVIAQDAENPLEVVLCHEVTHHMKRTDPAEFTNKG